MEYHSDSSMDGTTCNSTVIERPKYYSVVDESNYGSAIRIQNQYVSNCLFDVDSKVSQIRSDQVHDICDYMRNDEREKAYDSYISSRITLKVRINDDVFPINFKIVLPGKSTPKIVFGRDILEHVNLFVKNNEVQVLSKSSSISVRKSLASYVKLLLIFIGMMFLKTIAAVFRGLWRCCFGAGGKDSDEFTDYADLREEEEQLEKDAMRDEATDGETGSETGSEAEEPMRFVDRKEAVLIKTVMLYVAFEFLHDLCLENTLFQKLFLFC